MLFYAREAWVVFVVTSYASLISSIAKVVNELLSSLSALSVISTKRSCLMEMWRRTLASDIANDVVFPLVFIYLRCVKTGFAMHGCITQEQLPRFVRGWTPNGWLIQHISSIPCSSECGVFQSLEHLYRCSLHSCNTSTPNEKRREKAKRSYLKHCNFVYVIIIFE